MHTFCWNRSSWDEVADAPIEGSIAHRTTQPIIDSLPADEVEVRREPRTGFDEDGMPRVNLYSNGRTTYSVTPEPGHEVSVLLSHGMADKGIRAACEGKFDYIILPGPLYGEQDEKHPHLGYPKLDPIFRGEVAPLPRDERIRVLYAPTHGGGGEMHHYNDTSPPGIRAAGRTSWWKRDGVLSAFDPDVFDVVPCPHPRYREDRSVTFAEFVGADVVVADGGSTLWEAVALGIPVVTPAFAMDLSAFDSGTLEGRAHREGWFRSGDSPYRLARMVQHAARYGPLSAESRVRDGILPEPLRGFSGEAHAYWLLNDMKRW